MLALFVVAHHAWFTVFPDGARETNLWLKLFHFLFYGRLAVDGFIVLSGFCLMLPAAANGLAMRDKPSTFYLKRARRILPTYYAALLISLILSLTVVRFKTGTHWDISIPVTPRGVFAAIMMIHDWIDLFQMNHAFWSIAVEWRIYFLFPLIVLLFRRFGPIGSSIALCAASAFFARLLIDTDIGFASTTFSYFGLFVLGCLAATVRPSRTSMQWMLICATLLFAWTSSKFHVPYRMQGITQDLWCGLAAAALLCWWKVTPQSVSRQLLSMRWIAAIGVFAYSLYLTHAPIVQICWQLFVAPFHLTLGWASLVLLMTSIPASLIVAFLFFHVAEKPFLSRRQKRAAKEEMGAELGGATLPASVLAEPTN